MSKLHDSVKRSRFSNERVLISICFLAALGFWFILKMMQSYEHTRALKIEYTIPENLLFESQPPKHILVRYRGVGWSLIFSNQKFRQPLKIDYDETSRSITTLQLIRKVADHIGESGVEIINIDPEAINLDLVAGAKTRVPIIVEMDITTIPDHYADDQISISPDSVTVFGPPGQLSNIKSWPTEKIKLDNVRDTIRKKTSLVWPSPGITLDTYLADVVIPVVGYTEKVIELPIQIDNIPGNKRIIFEPRIAKVFCLIPLHKYNQVDESYFEFRADMDDINVSTVSTTLPITIKLSKEAAFIRNFDYQPKMVEIIFLPSEPEHRNDE